MNKTKSKRKNKRNTNKKFYGKGLTISRAVDSYLQSQQNNSPLPRNSSSLPPRQFNMMRDDGDIETGYRPGSPVIVEEIPRQHSYSSLNSNNSDDELLNYTFEINRNSPDHMSLSTILPRPGPNSIIVQQRPYSPYGKIKSQIEERPASALSYFNPKKKSKPIKKSNSFQEYMQKIGSYKNQRPPTFGGKKRKTKRKKCKRKRNTRKC